MAIASAAEPVTLSAVSALGPPDRHTALKACACLSLEWMRDGATAQVEVHRGEARAVIHEIAPDGHHDLSLSLTDGGTVPLERAPCAVVAPLARLYAAVLEVPEQGSAAGVACPDTLAGVGAYLTPRIVAVGTPDYGPMATVAAIGREGSPDLGLQSAWSAQRPLLGRCFRGAAGPVPGRVAVLGRVDRDGALSHLRVAEPGPTDAIDACVVARLGEVAVADGGRRRFRAEVAWEAPAVSP